MEVVSDLGNFWVHICPQNMAKHYKHPEDKSW